jgi:hypothetical protein
MKNSPENTPRLTCRLVRGCLATFGRTSDGDVRGPGASHVATCNDCQQFFSAGDAFDSLLKRDATSMMQVPPTGMEQRLLRAVREHAVAPRRGSATRYFSFALAGVAACGVAGVVWLQQPAQPAVQPKTSAENNTLAQVSETPAPSVSALMEADPLEREVDAVIADARQALRFLEQNFLPSTTPSTVRSG